MVYKTYFFVSFAFKVQFLSDFRCFKLLIHEMYELGIEPNFCTQSLSSAPKVA